MKKFTLMLAGLGIAAAALPATAQAAPVAGYASFQAGWQNINARQARLDQRINQGIRSGALTRGEAARLRNEFRALSRLEAQYRRSRPGLTMAERRDLDRRFDALSARIRVQKNDRQDRGRRW
jgi:Skp family chaperone for outer membrane proteins